MMQRKSIGILACLVLLISICIPAFAGGAFENRYVSLQAREYSNPYEKVIIPFDQELDAKSINDVNVKIVDAKGEKVRVGIELENKNMSVAIYPAKAYTAGKYTLYIERSVKYKNGRNLGKGILMKFTIKEENDSIKTVGNLENLKKLLTEANQYAAYGMRVVPTDGVVYTEEKVNNIVVGAAKSAASVEASANEQAASHSTTNVQVQGVDEGDIVKNDGQYIYQFKNRNIYVIKAYPVENMRIEDKINLNDKNFSPMELYIDDDRLVIIGTAAGNFKIGAVSSGDKYTSAQYYRRYITTKAIIYDITNKTDIKKVREIELEGNYVSSRKVGSNLYIVSNKYINYYPGNQPLDDPSISYRDSSLKEDFINIGYEDICYFPNSIQQNFMLIGCVNIDKNDKGVNVSAYLGSGNNIYMSTDNLYIAVQKYDIEPFVRSSARSGFKPVRAGDIKTMVYKFGLKDDNVLFMQKGEVPGTILNQFSMDENNSYFRIATTSGQIWGSSENVSKNNLYILDKNMIVCGKLEGMAPGERIYSVRFMGDRAYIVTFKKVDPLFVVDLKNARDPKILGTLKIPGYSDYLHPYDENHIIGFGKDTIEIPQKDQDGKIINTNAYYLGMKIALFDVTDVNNPKEKCREIIGDRGTYSELLNNHMALLFSKEKNIMAFPVNLFKLRDGQSTVNTNSNNSYPEYGSFSYQGAYVYSISIEKGFVLKGRITHISDDEYKMAGDQWYNSEKNINRILYINDILYTSSPGMIKATDLNSMQEIGKLSVE